MQPSPAKLHSLNMIRLSAQRTEPRERFVYTVRTGVEQLRTDDKDQVSGLLLHLGLRHPEELIDQVQRWRNIEIAEAERFFRCEFCGDWVVMHDLGRPSRA